MAAEKHLAGHPVAQYSYCAREAGAILGRHRGEGRTVRTRLAKRQIAAEHGDTRRAEGVRYGDEQRRAGVRSGAVRQDQAVTNGCIGRVQESAHGGGGLGILEWCDGGHNTHANAPQVCQNIRL